MNRVKKLVAIALPSLFVGGLVGYAAPGTKDGYWPSSGGVIVADATQPKKKRVPPGPPIPDRDHWAEPPPPTPPVPPAAHRPPAPVVRGSGKNGVSISINGNKVQITGIDDLVNEHLETVAKVLKNNPSIPKDVRDKINERMSKVRKVIDKRLKNVKLTDLDQLEAEIESMESELEEALEGLDTDLSQLGTKLKKDLTKKLGKIKIVDDESDGTGTRIDDDDTDDVTDTDDPNVDTAIADIKDVQLKPSQRDAIAKLRDDSAAQVAAVRKELDAASKRLEAALADPKVSDADVTKLVDKVSSHEAAIRKARLLAWVQARRVLDTDQIEKIEKAARKQHP